MKFDNNIYYYVFHIDKNKLIPILKQKIDIMPNDEYKVYYQDINGDNYLDVVIYQSILIGDLSQVNLYVPKTNTFSKAYIFRNPYFDTKNKTIIGLNCDRYQKPELYKYRWDGLKIDTIEYIFLDEKKCNQFILSKKSYHNPYSQNNKNYKTLKSLPNEYLQLENIDCFLNWNNRYR